MQGEVGGLYPALLASGTQEGTSSRFLQLTTVSGGVVLHLFTFNRAAVYEVRLGSIVFGC